MNLPSDLISLTMTNHVIRTYKQTILNETTDKCRTNCPEQFR